MSCKPKLCLGDLKSMITVERRSLASAAPGSAEPVHNYEPLFRVRAQIKTRAGVSEFNRVEINGTIVTHAVTIRHTTIPFDIRDRVRDGAGNLYSVLSIENVDERNEWQKLYCARQGHEAQAAAR